MEDAEGSVATVGSNGKNAKGRCWQLISPEGNLSRQIRRSVDYRCRGQYSRINLLTVNSEEGRRQEVHAPRREHPNLSRRRCCTGSWIAVEKSPPEVEDDGRNKVTHQNLNSRDSEVASSSVSSPIPSATTTTMRNRGMKGLRSRVNDLTNQTRVRSDCVWKLDRD